MEERAVKIHTPLTLRQFNNFLTVVIVGFAIYIIAMPFLPALSWWAHHSAPVISTPVTVSAPTAATDIPTEPTLLIPKLGLKEELHEGANASTLSLGLWHIPGTSNPTENSNTVVAGHRYTRQGAGVFYHLDLVKPGDKIYMYWGKKQYTYTVRTSSVVPPTQVSVAAPTSDARITLYTCTPMWTFKDRLVVVATRGEKS
jgi:LPXTG-site transpeptidase (sortase) family protein